MDSWQAVEHQLEHERKSRYDATHWCWAARVGIPDIQEKSSDAGEPSGTAGLPILQQLRRRDVTNSLVIVTRYFGGTKLGTGGLVRMYSESAAAALAAASCRTRKILSRLHLRSSYDDIGISYRLCQKFSGELKTLESSTGALLEYSLAPDHCADFRAAIVEESGGRIQVTEVGTWIS